RERSKRKQFEQNVKPTWHLGDSMADAVVENLKIAHYQGCKKNQNREHRSPKVNQRNPRPVDSAQVVKRQRYRQMKQEDDRRDYGYVPYLHLDIRHRAIDVQRTKPEH